jgi:hypothetical protein
MGAFCCCFAKTKAEKAELQPLLGPGGGSLNGPAAAGAGEEWPRPVVAPDNGGGCCGGGHSHDGHGHNGRGHGLSIDHSTKDADATDTARTAGAPTPPRPTTAAATAAKVAAAKAADEAETAPGGDEQRDERWGDDASSMLPERFVEASSSSLSADAGSGAGDDAAQKAASEEEGKGMSVKELKAALAERGVGCADCYEKSDLVQRFAETKGVVKAAAAAAEPASASASATSEGVGAAEKALPDVGRGCRKDVLDKVAAAAAAIPPAPAPEEGAGKKGKKKGGKKNKKKK